MILSVKLCHDHCLENVTMTIIDTFFFTIFDKCFCIRILVVGAHWDTVDKTGGLNDNGSEFITNCCQIMLSSTNVLDVIVNNSAFMIMWTQVRDGGAAWASTSSLPWPVQEQVRDDHDHWSCWSSDHDYNHDANHGYYADHDYDTDRNVWRTVFEIQDYKPSLIRESLTYQNQQCFAGGATKAVCTLC